LGRIKLTVRYDGTEYSGSQVQPGLRTVEGTLKDGLESLLKQPVKLLFASRTDAGVHADGNVAAFDAELRFPVERLPQLVDRQLPEDMAVREAEPTSDEFHPRFDAVSRTYVYRFMRGADVPVDRRRYCCPYTGQWDGAAVGAVLAGIHGVHDFAEFAASEEDGGSTNCAVLASAVSEHGAEVTIEITANRFLRNMICRLAGAIALVADGRVTVDQVLAALEQPKDFRLKPAPAKGLTLKRVDYQ
jgi:tRNA pseudouridine38-40 synthase